MPPEEQIRRLLEQARHKARRHELLLAVAAAVVASLFSLVVGAVAAVFLGTAIALPLTRLLVAAALVIVIVAFARRRPRAVFASAELPRVIGLDQAGERSAVLSAAQFVSQAPRLRRVVGGGHSPDLVRAHLEHTATRLGPAHCETRLREHFRQFDRSASAGLSAVLLLVLLTGVFAPSELRGLAYGLWGAGEAELSAVPLVGDLSLTLRPPAYVGGAPREVRGGDGTIRALRGTSVLLRATAERNVRGAELHIGGDAGAPARVVPLSVQNGRELTGEFVVNSNERYRFVLKPPFGAAVKERAGHPIIAEDDKLPTVELREPAQDLELKESSRVMLKYTADDDYALSEMSLVYKPSNGVEQRVALELPESRTKLKGSYAFDLAPLKLKAGDVVTVELEVKDNDTVSGPKRAVSATRRITIYSADQHRRDLLARLRGLVDQLVDLLADELENSFTAGADGAVYGKKAVDADERALALAGEMLEIGRGLKESDGEANVKFSLPTERSGIELRTAYTTKKAGDQALLRAVSASPALAASVARQKADAILLLERTVIYFEDLRGLATLEELKAATKDLAATQQQLKDLLQRYKETGDEALRAALESEMQSLKQRLGEIMQKMAELRKSLPEEFVNREAFARRDMQNIFERIDELLAQNKTDELAKELERLDNLLHNMERNLNDAEKDYGGDRYAGLRRELQEFQANLESVEAAQKQTTEETEKQEQRYRQEVSKRMGESLDKVVQESLKDIEDAQRALDRIKGPGMRESESKDRASARLYDTRQALESRDFLEARDMTRLSQSDLSELSALMRSQIFPNEMPERSGDRRADNQQVQEAQQKVQEVLKRLEKLFPEPNEVLSPRDRQALQELRQRQQQIAQRTRQLGEQMKNINGQAPIFGADTQGELDGATQMMDRAGGELGQSQAGRARTSQRGALAKLQKMREALQKQGGQGGQGIPMPFAGTGMPNPFGMGGNDPQNQEKVEIPSGETFKVPPEFRRDILDAMKQGSPERFKKQVDDFYRELIK